MLYDWFHSLMIIQECLFYKTEKMTPHFARPSFLLLLPKLPPIQEEEVLLLRELFCPIQYDRLIFINHKVHTNLFHGFAS